MKIGLIIAIERELQAFLRLGTALTCETVCSRQVYRAELAGHTLFALRSGAGTIDAAAGAQLLICKYGCGVMLNFGVTGALDPALQVKDLLVVRKVLHYDLDTSCIDPVKPGQYGEFPDEYLPMDPGLIALVQSLRPGIREAVVASGDKFIEEKAEKRALFARGCNICDMESAALSRVCWLNGVRCLSIKCISDAYDGDGRDFAKNVASGAEKAFALLLEVLKAL